MAGVRLQGIEKTYGKNRATLRGLDLEVHDGELLVLVGPSGCGKSTILRIIAGLEEVSAGSVWIGDRDVTQLPPKSRDIAMVFQSYALYPHKTARGNLGFALENQGRSKQEIEERVRWAADLLGITPLLDKLPKALSGGERQRVALGRAIVREPKVFLFDEPLSNLDAKLRSDMRAEIGALHRRLGTTMVYVTHDQVEAMTLGERVVVLDRGEIQQAGTPMEIYYQPVNRFVGSFIGSPSMNVFPSGALPPSHPLSIGTFLVGVRPEDLVLDAGGSLRMRIVLVEPTGGECLVHGETPHGPLVVKAPGHPTIAIGDEVGCRFETERAHLFDPESGRRFEPTEAGRS
jgi:multiple sugar transport system ATP-binding protein